MNIKHIVVRRMIKVFFCLSLLSTSSLAQDVSDFTTEEANPLSMLDDITSSLLTDDQITLNDTGLPDPSEEDPGNGVPVDGGLSLLLAAGAAYGARRLRKTALEKKKAKGDE